MISEELTLISGYLDGRRPIVKMLVSDWANENIHLTTENSAEPGQFRTSRTPYLKEIMDNLSPVFAYKRMIAMKGVQLGFTQAALNAVCCYVDINPTPIMYVMPTIDTARAITDGRLDTIIENSPVLKEKIRPARERDSGNTKILKRFPGGMIIFSGANSASSLRSRPVQILILDEVDAYPKSLEKEGSPVKLAENRTTTFSSRKKVFLLSTPLIHGTSTIEHEYELTDQRKYFLPCPHCGGFQDLKFANLIWEKGKWETAQYRCTSCNQMIEERFKAEMLEKGEWRVTKPENISEERIGYHLNSLYSPLGWMSWAEIAQKWEEAQGNNNDLQVFINTILAETWKETGEAPPWESLYQRREDYKFNKPNKDVVFLTAGVDVQKDRLEVEIVGWCRGKRSYSIDYRILLGDTTDEGVWNQLKDIVNETWEREGDGMILPLRLMAIDTGWNTQHVYDFCRQFEVSRVIPVKGQAKLQQLFAAPKWIEYSKAGKKVGKIRLFNVGVSHIKSELYGWLRQHINPETKEEPKGYCHFPMYDEDHFKGLTAEALVPDHNRQGYLIYAWKKVNQTRNEQLDTRVYARAAAAVVGMDRWSDKTWDEVSGNYNKKTKPDGQQKKKSSSFWQNH